MKNRVKKVWLSLLSLSMVGVMGGSALLRNPFSGSDGNGGAKDPASSITATVGKGKAEKLSDNYKEALSSDRFINRDYLAEASPAALNVHTDGTRRIIVELESESQLDTYLTNQSVNADFRDFTEFVNAEQGKAYAEALKGEHAAFFKALDATKLTYEVRHTYTSILNAVSLVVDDDDVDEISKLVGVKNVIYSEVYAVPTVEPTINVVDVYSTGIYDASDVGYKGDGMLVAVLDTGFDVAHSAFSTMPEVEKITKADVENVFDQLEATTYGEAITVDDVYYNEKVPFAYDYADGDSDVFAISNSHGVHVAGIIAGQDESVTAEDGKAFENGDTFLGVAPNAQLMIGKVFPDTDDGQDNGAATDDILAALADCVTVGADVINMSLGTTCGFSRAEDGSTVNAIYDKIYAAGINLVVAASNSYSSAMNGAYGSTNLTSNPDSSTVGSPSTYAAALSVASVSGQKSSYMQLSDGTAIYFKESSNAAGQQGDFMAELLGDLEERTLNYVIVPGYGKASNYTATVQAELKKGNCVAVVSRGDISFEEKQKNAYDNGAVACIIYNNVSGNISASLGTGKKIPTCTVNAAIGRKFVQSGTGTITLNKNFKAGPFMSDFSSWGPTNDLKIKPEITAHGGEITSAVVGGYDQFSGTSMASPNMAGAVTLLRQYVYEHFGLTGTELSNRVNQLLMSTATIVYDENGLPYSVRKQGAGLGDIAKAMNTQAYLYVENNSKPKLELGDDPNRTGVYTMEFHVANTSTVEKTYNIDALIMTESVSIDGITVEEKAHMLDAAQKSYAVNGRASGGTFTLGVGEDANVRVTIALSAEEKAYLDQNFENGMYVEGYVTLEDQGEGVDLSIPYLAFYGDWTDAPIFDKTTYEVSADYYDSSIKDEDKAVSAIYETVAIGKYYRGVDYYLPLGQYIYSLPEGVDSGVVSSVDKIAIGNDDYGIYEFYAVYFGMLRSAAEMTVSIENAVTGEVIRSETQYNIRKAFNATPTFSLLEFSPYDLGMNSNERYTLVFEAKLDYDKGEERVERQEFSFYVDYQAPMIYDGIFRYEEQDGQDRRVYLDLEIYDNHYTQSIQLFTLISESAIDWITEYPIPVTGDVRDGISKVTIDVTDYMDNFANSYGSYANTVGVRMDDYAMNSAAYVLPVNTTVVDAVSVNYTYEDAEGEEVVASLAGETVVLKPGQALDLTEDTGFVYREGGNLEVAFSTKLVGYSTYVCTNLDKHGVECGYVYNERTGLTYKKGDYYYDAATATVLQKEADDSEPTYPANTLFTSIVAEPVEKDGNRYKKPESKHFVCPKCATEETFSFNTRSGKITIKTFERTYQDPMIEDVMWVSGNTSVVKVEAGKLYAVGAGTATITAYALATVNYNTFNFTVTVEGDPVTSYIEGLTVGSYYNRTTGVSRSVSNGYAEVDCGSVLDLYPTFQPWYITEIKDLTWQSANPDVAEIESSSYKTARVICKKPGAVKILLSSPSNGLIGTFQLVIGDEYTLYSYYFYQYDGVGYSETYEEDGEERKMLVIPANLGIVNMGFYSEGRNGPFAGNKNLDTVVVPQGVTTLGLNCFAGSSIRRIYLPSSLEAISYGAFNSSKIEEVYWYDASERSGTGIVYDADNNTYNWPVFYEEATTECTAKRLAIGSAAFAYCYGLESFDFSKTTALYAGAFISCRLLQSVDLTTLRYAGVDVFKNCTELKDVVLTENTVVNGNMFNGSGVEHIDYYGSTIPDSTFSSATSLRSITVHNDIDYVGSYAFRGCAALTTVTFEGSCEYIGVSAFEGCAALATFTIPKGVTLIGARAFANCTSLVTLSVNPYSNIQEVGMGVFVGCNALKQITIAGSGTSRYYNTVSYDNGNHKMLTDRTGTRIILVPPTYDLTGGGDVFTVPLETGLREGVTAIGPEAYAYNTSLDGKEVIVPEGITSIGFAAFQNTGITKIVIASTVTEIDAYAFYGCSKLETVVFLCDLDVIPERMFYQCSSLKYIQLPGSVEYIGSYAFAASGIQSIHIGENVELIDTGAFSSCRSLTNITFADNSKLIGIGPYAFRNCTVVEQIAIPDSVQILGDYAFAGCTSLTEAYVSAGLEVMGSYVFSSDLMLAKVVFGDGAKMIGDYAFFTPYGSSGFYYQQYLRDITIPESVEYIGAYAFAGNTVLDSLDISGVRLLNTGAFYYTSALTTVTINDEMEYIGPAAFMHSAIENIDLSLVEYFDTQCFYQTNVKAGEFTNALVIGNSAFYNCPNITEVNLPNVEIIYSSAFFTPGTVDGVEYEGKITKVTFGEKLRILGGAAFFNSAITEIYIPASVELIGTPAFAGCFKLETIVVAEENETYFVDEEFGGLYAILPNGTYELMAVPNALKYDYIDEDWTKLQPYKILEGTSRIAAWAMGYCNYIHAVEIPASVESIGTYGFYFMGMGIIEDLGEDLKTASRDVYPKYIFKGLQAPKLETSYSSTSNALTSLYANFSYPIGYLMNDMIIPVNAKGFESTLYEFFFMNKEYSEELIEPDTEKLVDWLETLDVSALTLADEAKVTEMNMIYFMLSKSQKDLFVSEEAVAKLNAAVEKIAALKAAASAASV